MHDQNYLALKSSQAKQLRKERVLRFYCTTFLISQTSLCRVGRQDDC